MERRAWAASVSPRLALEKCWSACIHMSSGPMTSSELG